MTHRAKPDVAPAPTVMPVDREFWAKQLNLSNFINSYYQYRDLQLCKDCTTVLVVGPGQGLDVSVFKWRGYQVTTIDIDDTFKPDYLGSVHDLGMFANGQFDAVIASHVLEHLAVPYLNPALSEIARVGRYALIYLPVHGMHIQFRLTSNFRRIDLGVILNLFNYIEKPEGIAPRYMQGQHFWEVGLRGFRVADILKRMSLYFEILCTYRNRDWLPSQNFVLKSKINEQQSRIPEGMVDVPTSH